MKICVNVFYCAAIKSKKEWDSLRHIERHKINQQSIKKHGWAYLSAVHWVVILVSLLITLVAWFNTRSNENQIQSAQFEYQSQQILNLLNERMLKYHDALSSGVASIHAHQLDIDVNEWRVFTDVLTIDQKYPGIMGIGVIYHVKQSDLSDFLGVMRNKRPDFEIHPQHDQGDYWPITYIEPVETNYKAVGLDMAFEHERLSAAYKARDTGSPQITGPIILVQDSLQTPGFLFYHPFYKSIQAPIDLNNKQSEFVGLVYAPFIVKNLMRGTLSNQDRLINFRISDGGNVLYDELSETSVDYDFDPMFKKQLEVDMYGRQWVFDMQSTLKFRGLNERHVSNWILAAGIVVEALLVTLFILLAKANHQTSQLANKQKVIIKSKEKTLVKTFDHMADGLVLVDADDHVVQFNQPAMQLFGVESAPNQLTSAWLFKQVNLDGKKFKDLYQNDKSTKELTFKRAGQEIPVEIRVNQFNLNQQSHLLATIRDMSEYYLVEQSLMDTSAKLKAAIDASASGFVIIDEAGLIQEYNSALLNWIDLQPIKDSKTNYFSLLSEHEVEAAMVQIGQLFSGQEKTSQIERQFVSTNGKLKWGLESAAAIEDSNEKVVYVAIQILDIQKEKQLLTRLQNKNISLKKSNDDLEQFAYIASHDLKSPLNAIMQLSSWVQEDCVELLPEESKKHLQLMQSRSERMSKLLEDLLDYSRISRYKYPYESFSIKQLVNEQFSMLSNTQSFTLACDDVHISAPKIPFEIIIRNLLSNAIKHNTNEFGKITVMYQKQADSSSLTISDDGPGISADMHEKIFEMFQTLVTKDITEGSGMGLAIIRKIITHYGGEVVVISDKGLGAAFKITWPNKEETLNEI